jgi:hypothetical protein
MYKTKGTIKRVGDETSTELGLPLIYVEIEQENKALLTAACLETPMVDQVKKCAKRCCRNRVYHTLKSRKKQRHSAGNKICLNNQREQV